MEEELSILKPPVKHDVKTHNPHKVYKVKRSPMPQHAKAIKVVQVTLKVYIHKGNTEIRSPAIALI